MIGLEVAYHKILHRDRIFALNMRKFQFILPEKNYMYQSSVARKCTLLK